MQSPRRPCSSQQNLKQGFVAVQEPRADGPPARPMSEILEDIDEVLETIVRPYAQSDGGDVVFHTFDSDEGTLWVRMEGACENCASSTVTLRFKVLSAMKHYCPEVVAVKRVELDEDSDSDSDDD